VRAHDQKPQGWAEERQLNREKAARTKRRRGADCFLPQSFSRKIRQAGATAANMLRDGHGRGTIRSLYRVYQNFFFAEQPLGKNALFLAGLQQAV
jgi:hypothetical protein